MHEIFNKDKVKKLYFPEKEYIKEFKEEPVGFSFILLMQNALAAYCALLSASKQVDIIPSFKNGKCTFIYTNNEIELGYISNISKKKIYNLLQIKKHPYLMISVKNKKSSFELTIELRKQVIKSLRSIKGDVNSVFNKLFKKFWKPLNSKYSPSLKAQSYIDQKPPLIKYNFDLLKGKLFSKLSEREKSVLALILHFAKDSGTTLLSANDILYLTGFKRAKNQDGKRGGFKSCIRDEMLEIITKLEHMGFIQAQKCNLNDCVSPTDYSYLITLHDKLKNKKRRPLCGFLHTNIFKYDTNKYIWEKQIGVALYRNWARKNNRKILRPLFIKDLIKTVGKEELYRYPSRLQTRFEKALDRLVKNGIIGGWQYFQFQEEDFFEREWLNTYIQNKVIIEPPNILYEYYSPKHKIRKNFLKKEKDELDVGEILYKMKKKNMSQLMLAETLKIPKSTLSRILTGRNKPSVENFIKLVDWLDS